MTTSPKLLPDLSAFDPTKEENWHYHDEYDFWYIEYPELNEEVRNGNQRYEPSRERGFRPWENIQRPTPTDALEALHQSTKLACGNYDYQCGYLDALNEAKAVCTALSRPAQVDVEEIIYDGGSILYWLEQADGILRDIAIHGIKEGDRQILSSLANAFKAGRKQLLSGAPQERIVTFYKDPAEMKAGDRCPFCIHNGRHRLYIPEGYPLQCENCDFVVADFLPKATPAPQMDAEPTDEMAWAGIAKLDCTKMLCSERVENMKQVYKVMRAKAGGAE